MKGLRLHKGKTVELLERRFRDLKLSRKMILVYAVILVICLLFSMGMLQISLKIFDEHLYEKSLQELDFFSQEMNDKLQNVENLSYDIALDVSIQEQLYKLKELNYSSSDYSYESYRFRMMLANRLKISNGIKNIIFTDGKKTRFTVGESAKQELSAGQMEELLEKFHDAGGAYVAVSPTQEYQYMLSGRDIRSYIDSVSLSYLGSLVFTTDIAGMIQTNVDALEVQSARLCVFSGNGLIYENQEGMYENVKDLGKEKGYQIRTIDGMKYFLCYLKSSGNGWSYVNMVPYSSIFRQSRMLRMFSIAGFILLFWLSVIVMKKLALMMTKPLEQLTDSMRIVETGDFTGARNQLETEARGDEIGQISQEFGVMLDQIDYLIHENYEKQLLLRDTKLQMLQAQINPHFLYNTLNAIHWMIRQEKNEDAARMILVLGKLLRAAFDKRQYISLTEELELVKDYITLQEYRYQKRVTFQLTAEGQLDTVEVPHMFIQPLVENAILHGVDNSLKPCTVSVSVSEGERKICIEVSDNGPGMTEEELAAARNFTIKSKGNGIGLKNIYERLKLSYEDMRFEIDSEAGSGTTVRIVIPKEASKREEKQ